MYGTITMKEVRKGMLARKSALKAAEEKSFQSAIKDRTIHMMRPISVLLAFSLVASAATFV